MTSCAKLPRLLIFFSLLAVLAGCVQTKTTPGYARAGDNIVIGLGGIERNAGGEIAIKASDLTIVLTDANNVQHILSPQYIFKTYLDHSAQMNTFAIDGTAAQYGLVGMVPYDGGWFIMVPLRYAPPDSTPLPLAVGPATISVTSPKLTNTANFLEGSLSIIPIEIIEGVADGDPDFARQFIGYIASREGFVISPDDLGGVSEVGGAYLAINYSDDSIFKNGLEPVVVPSGHNPYVQMNYNLVPNGDGTGTIFVTLLNPVGFKSVAASSTNSSLLSDLSIKLNYFSDATPAVAKTKFSIDTQKSYYIDLNGTVLEGISPTLTHVEDL